MSPAPKPALDMSVNVAGITLKNPVMAASGSFAWDKLERTASVRPPITVGREREAH